jgi:hypothetical protein
MKTNLYLRYPYGVHVDDDCNIIVSDYGNHQVLTKDGDYQYQFSLSKREHFVEASIQ